MSLQQIVVYNHRKLTRDSLVTHGPNPKKISLILEELNVPYKLIDVEDFKSEEFRKINPNGRLPAIVDPNNGNFTLWESGAIAEYLVETYDKSMKLSVSGDAEKWQLKQFLHFQMSGQGPYYGQAVWFHMLHGQDIPSAKKRYLEQIDRVWSVTNDILKDKKYFLGSKLTYADLCFFPWEFAAHSFLGEYLEAAGFDAKKKYPNYWAWFERLKTQHSVKTVYGL
ncbi:Glutathione S-transferase 2 [Beauveria bassiana D1-5]|uniref:Glutathione S-transferase 2 n=1 Tax=Beauveria bassiana D1-5 TaxID=1245745 RepID=A0A0A2V7U4_BEABA|nr:Glutathione S-transferase 2 [Beauveria bassiana D1-5]